MLRALGLPDDRANASIRLGLGRFTTATEVDFAAEAIAAAVLAPALLAWPLALYLASPDLFGEWLWVNNLGRFLGFVRLGESHALWFYPVTLLWLSFPLWPFAIAAGRAAWAGKVSPVALQLPSVAFVVTMAGAGGGQLGGGQLGAPVPVTPEALAAQAAAYAKLFTLFVKHRDAVNRVTFWGLNDRRSWRRGQNPLVFDADNQPKPALQAIVDSRTPTGVLGK